MQISYEKDHFNLRTLFNILNFLFTFSYAFKCRDSLKLPAKDTGDISTKKILPLWDVFIKEILL